MPDAVCLLAFNAANRLVLRRHPGGFDLPFVAPDLAATTALLKSAFTAHTPPAEYFQTEAGGRALRVFFSQVAGASADPDLEFRSLEQLDRPEAGLSPALATVISRLGPHLIDIPYLHLGENDFIYKFRPEKRRNRAIYAQDTAAGSLYQSDLFTAVKKLARRHESSADDPVRLDFGAIQYVIPSHFGFCLGVKNAIEKAYETLAENPGRRVFMLSELIHNPFVNEDLRRRGLGYLQSDKGVPYTTTGRTAEQAPEAPLLWDTLTSEDIVVIPAFGATDEDKSRLVRKGLALAPYDATCMLVEKVWKAARAYGREGYTVVIHGKFEHEETKATFSNTRRHAPSVIVRNLEEARILGEIVTSDDPVVRARFHERFAGRHTPDFDVDKHLQRLAVVNQTTLLVNETREIINYLRDLYRTKFGADLPGQPPRVGGGGARNDTLCYATQVNQDALARALDEPLDAAFVIGGRNSSNTYQLYRLCAERLGKAAYFIQSEANILSRDAVEHYVFVGKGHDVGGGVEIRSLWPDGDKPRRVLITGGASCPDGIIQQVIVRLNSLFPADQLKSVDQVLATLA